MLCKLSILQVRNIKNRAKLYIARKRRGGTKCTKRKTSRGQSTSPDCNLTTRKLSLGTPINPLLSYSTILSTNFRHKNNGDIRYLS